MATFGQLWGDRLDRELGSADRSSLFTEARRKAAVNEAQLEFAKQTECYQRIATITVAHNTPRYDLDAAGIISAEDFLCIASQGAEHAFTDVNGAVTYAAGKDFPRKDPAQLNEEDPGWRNTSVTTNIPSSYGIEEDGGSVFLFLVPIPKIGAGESAKVNLPYVASPPDMTADSHEPFSVTPGSTPNKTLRPWHQALVHYAAALLEPLRKHEAGRKTQLGLFAAQVADYLQKKRPKGGQTVRLARDYYREARGHRIFARAVDPTLWP